MAVSVGQPAPDFALPDQAGREVRLSSFRGRPVVVFFFPKAFTPVCTKEACSFRDAADDPGVFGDPSGAVAGSQCAAVIGVSSDSVETLRAFSERVRAGFPLLSDEGGRVRAAWGVPKTLGLFPGRVTYVLDRDLVVRAVIDSALRANRHVAEAVKAVRGLSTDAAAVGQR